MRLASHLGWSEEEVEDLSARALTRWMAFANIEPLLGRRLDYIGALIAAVAGNPWREEPLSVADLMPEWEKLGDKADARQDGLKMAESLRSAAVKRTGKGQAETRPAQPARGEQRKPVKAPRTLRQKPTAQTPEPLTAE